MQKEATGEMQKCPDCGGSMENHEPDCPRAEKSDKKKLEDDLDSKSANKHRKTTVQHTLHLNSGVTVSAYPVVNTHL